MALKCCTFVKVCQPKLSNTVHRTMLKLDAESDMRRWPFRGIFAEIAVEEGVSRQAIQQRFRQGNPAIVRKVEDRKKDRWNRYVGTTYAAAA